MCIHIFLLPAIMMKLHSNFNRENAEILWNRNCQGKHMLT